MNFWVVRARDVSVYIDCLTLSTMTMIFFHQRAVQLLNSW